MHSRRGARQRRKKWLLRLEVALALVLAALLIGIAQRMISSARIRGEEAAAAARYPAAAAPTATQGNGAAGATGAPGEIQPEIAELMQENPDAVGLLHFEGDRTLYVCRSEDNAYYMNHRFDGSEDPAGMIYMDCRNTLWPRSDNLILYGHNMRDGSRFGTLQRFEEKAYLRQHPIFQLVDRYATVDYVPFAIFHTTVLTGDAAYYPFDQINFSDAADFDRYVSDVKALSVLELPVEVTYGDRLMTLATCYSDLERGRLVIVCREVKPGEDFAGS